MTKLIKTTFFTFVCFLVSNTVNATEPYPSIAMFEWQNDGATEDGFRYGIEKVFPDARFYVYNLSGEEYLLELFIDVALERNHDLYYASGTAITSRLLQLQTMKPIVFTMVQAPVEEGIIADWLDSRNNANGISSRVPILNQLKTLKSIVNFRELGVLYQPGNPDSQQQVFELERLQSVLDYRVSKIVTSDTDLKQLPETVLAPIDAVYITHSPIFDDYKNIISQLNEAGIPTLASDMALVTNKGALLGLVPDKFQIGRLAALNAKQVLEGAPPSSVPSRELDFFMVVLNMNTARKLGVQIPFSLLVIADTIVR